MLAFCKVLMFYGSEEKCESYPDDVDESLLHLVQCEWCDPLGSISIYKHRLYQLAQLDTQNLQLFRTQCRQSTNGNRIVGSWSTKDVNASVLLTEPAGLMRRLHRQRGMDCRSTLPWKTDGGGSAEQTGGVTLAGTENASGVSSTG